MIPPLNVYLGNSAKKDGKPDNKPKDQIYAFEISTELE